MLAPLCFFLRSPKTFEACISVMQCCIMQSCVMKYAWKVQMRSQCQRLLILFFLDRKRHTRHLMASIMPTMNKMILVLRIITAAFGIVSAFDVQHIFSSQSRESQHDGYALYANSFGVPFRNESYDYV